MDEESVLRDVQLCFQGHRAPEGQGWAVMSQAHWEAQGLGYHLSLASPEDTTSTDSRKVQSGVLVLVTRMEQCHRSSGTGSGRIHIFGIRTETPQQR